MTKFLTNGGDNSAVSATAVALSPWAIPSLLATEKLSPPIVVFSKVYQTLSLNFDGAAAVTAEAGWMALIRAHIEFDWTENGKTKNREALVKALKDSSAILRKWLAEA